MCSFTVILPPYPSLELILFSTFRRVRSWPHLQDFAGVFCSFIPTFSKNLSLALPGTWEQSVVRLPFLQVSTTQIRRTVAFGLFLLSQEQQGNTELLRCQFPFFPASKAVQMQLWRSFTCVLIKNPLSLWLIFISRRRSTNQVTEIEPAHSPI